MQRDRRGAALLLPGVLAMFLLAPVVRSHEFWLEPAAFRMAPSSGQPIHLRVGEQFRGDLVARRDSDIIRFIAVQNERWEPILGQDGASPAGFFEPPRAGTWAIGYETLPRRIFLRPREFEAYLRHEGLDWVIDERARREESERMGFEAYSRSAKSLIHVGEGPLCPGQKIGLPLELTPGTPLLRAGTALRLPVQLEFRGQPRAHAKVLAWCQDAPEITLSAETDPQGMAWFELPSGGVWLFASVHIERAAEGEKADWRSYWSSLTVEL